MDFQAVTMEDSGANRDTDTMGVEQAKLLMKLICGSSTDFRELKELRVRARFPDNNQRRILTQEAQSSQHMALASMAAAFQSLQVCISHTVSRSTAEFSTGLLVAVQACL